MPWAPAIQLPERLDGIERHRQLAESFVVLADGSDFGQVEQGIKQHGRMANGQHEAIAVRPHGILRIEAKELLPESIGYRRHRHGSSWMSRICCLHSIHGQRADGVDTGQVHVLLHRSKGERRCYTHEISFRIVVQWYPL